MVDINLSKSVRSNLSSLQNTANLMSNTSNRLSTGNKVNSALDNPTNFFTASSLNSRAGDLNQLMDSMNNGIKTIEAADNGLTAITKNLESMQSTLRQARQDKSFQTESFAVTLNTDNEFAAGSTVSFVGGATGQAITGGTPIAIDVAGMNLDEAVEAINTAAADGGTLEGAVRASNDNGKLRIENLSTGDLNVAGATSVTAGSIDGNTVRADLAAQYNELRDQLDKLSDDASFNGINLLRGDNLSITFNETGTSSIDVQAKEGKTINSANLGVETSLNAADLDSDAGIDGFISQIKSALGSVRDQSSAFGSNLSAVQNRQDFTQKMINTLETGAGNLTLADMNQEAANMMALQTRQSLASSTLSMANTADQNVLQLLR
ncbi:MAG: flagellin [Candidatus Devosia phytovorans]|uniref:Flagellin n=1 Tax=Candidatus Devosia phytovorans TaxID=3121372 RepID=A0AAJ5VVF5_9HYPH|nr:flagellin [Devosia sp.]WEK05534.1 MAG: flagellin [Devosia sp.]